MEIIAIVPGGIFLIGLEVKLGSFLGKAIRN